MFLCHCPRSDVLCVFIENEPPVFHAGQLSLKTFYGENLVYQFSATDPEGSAVLLTLRSGPRDAVLSPAGLLIWKALSTTPVTFELAVTDDCNAETRAAVKVSSRKHLVKCCVYKNSQKVLQIFLNVVDC